MSFDLARLRRTDWIIAVGGLALLVFVFFFKWFGGGVSGLPSGFHISGTTIETTGWQTFTSSRWIWLATILVAGSSAPAAAFAYKPDGPVRLGTLCAGLGTVSAALIVYRIVHHPSASVSAGQLHASYGLKFGIWLGLIAALVITLGGYLQSRPPAAPRSESPTPSKAPFSGLTVAEEQRTPTDRAAAPTDRPPVGADDPAAPGVSAPGSESPDDAP